MYYGNWHVAFSFRNDPDITASDRAFTLRRENMFKLGRLLIGIIAFLDAAAFTCACLFPNAKVIFGNIGLGLMFLMEIVGIILAIFNDKI